MKASSRSARQTIRTRSAQTRAAHRAHRQVATGLPQTARTHLVAAGLDDTTAKRYAGAFSRGVQADATVQAPVKLKGRTRKLVPAKPYDVSTFAARLSVYRPKDLTAAARFERAAHRLAA
ncbi:hypothetical protein [Streptomyces cylindrosporus]|uniref:Integrase n=1 Tax=Streptomyces cylindrosporus TaxID=2927583 RepID=A0ABS9YPI7_9ACTN|nr:hypothetical protein [Streptomyces cylindrosporus]MCI3279193.1 hypothetical protein [Streptomyces cylindrosporus]